MSVRKWLLLWIPGLIALTIASAILTNLSFNSKINYQWENIYTNLTHEEVSTIIRAEQAKARVVVEMLLKNGEILRALAEKNRDKLIELIMPYHKLCSENFDVSNIHLFTSDGISLLRTADLSKYGDDVKGFRPDIVQTLNTKQPTASMSIGAITAMIRYISPAFLDGKLIGGIEANVSLSEGFTKNLKGDTIIKIFFDAKGNRIDKITKSRPDLDDFTGNFNTEEILKGNPQKFIKGNFAYIAFPIKDFGGKVIAAIFRKVDVSHITSLVQESTLSQLIISVAIASAIIAISLLIGRNIRRKLFNLDRAMDELSHGKLQISLDSSGSDEFSTIGKKLSSVVERLRSVISSSASAAERVQASSEKIYSSIANASSEIQSITAAIQEISSLAESNSASIEETNAGIEEVASGAQTAAKVASEAAEAANLTLESANKTLRELSQNAEALNQVSKEAEESLKILESLMSSIQRVTGFVSTITSIADQTNLLALNAAIEAARAGELGRGFAVVAEEVRKLAEEAARAAKEVSQVMGNLSKESEMAASAIRKSISDIMSSSKSVSAMASDIREILEKIKKLSDSVKNIASIAEEQSASTQEMASATDQISRDVIRIAENINSTSKAVESIASNLESLSKEGEELKELANSLEKALSFFKLSK